MKRKFKVKGMHCTSCAMIIENEIEDLDGIDDVECNYKKETLEIDSNKEIDTKQLNNKFQKFGYTFEKS